MKQAARVLELGFKHFLCNVLSHELLLRAIIFDLRCFLGHEAPYKNVI